MLCWAVPERGDNLCSHYLSWANFSLLNDIGQKVFDFHQDLLV